MRLCEMGSVSVAVGAGVMVVRFSGELARETCSLFVKDGVAVEIAAGERVATGSVESG